MILQLQQLDRQQALEILDWRYPSPYDFYNFNADSLQQDLCYLLERKNAFFAILNQQEELEGYCSFGEDGKVAGGCYNTKALDIGMGIRPDLVGKGRGKYYAKAIVEYGIKQYSAKQLRVTIADFNQRAKRVWQQLGFKEVEKFVKIGTESEFVVMMFVVSSVGELPQ